MSAGSTLHVIICPKVSTRMWRLRPLTRLCASNPRMPPRSVVFTDWPSMMTTDGQAVRPACRRACCKVIAATASEAPHVLDGLLYHQTGLQIEEHYTDTGGATDHVFGLCHLFGFRFAQRIRDLKDRSLYLFPGQKPQPILDPLVGGFADVHHITA